MIRFAALALLIALPLAPAQGEEALQSGWTPPTGAEDAPDIARGESLWGKCQACHTYEMDARHSVGPNLHGVFGRKAGSAPGFRRYSRAMKESEIVWTAETMNTYLKATLEYIPDSKMYAGLAIPRDRLDLIAWLQTVTRPNPEAVDTTADDDLVIR